MRAPATPRAARDMGVSTEETAAWRDAADAAHIPFDEELGVHPQSEGFTTYAEWDFTEKTNYPLLLHEPYVLLYPAQVIKQTDLVLAMYWQSHKFTRRAEGAQRRLLRAAHGARLVAVGLHPGGDVRQRRAFGAGARLHLRGGSGRPARPAPQHPRRVAHGVAGRRVDGSGRTASAACATTRASCPSTRICPTASHGCGFGCAGGTSG